MRWKPLLACGAMLCAAIPAAAIEIGYEKFVLDNGLTVLVHEDHKAPIVAVNIWYAVGSKNEKPGKTGFAHLFEHLMFQGTENHDDEYFAPLEAVGATDLNGTTNRDRTNYFQNVPVNALDLALFLESERMGHLLGVVTQEKLDEQRGVVQNEKRQGENQPYGKVWKLIADAAYPEGHPYSWMTIGSMEDLEAASLEDVHEWFRTYYGPNNAVLVIAGDIEPAAVRKRVEHYFGDIPPGPPISRLAAWPARRDDDHRQILEDRVPQSRIYKVWNGPPMFTPEHHRLEMAERVLATGKTSRLFKRLVYDDQTATDVGAFQWNGTLGSLFIVMASVQPGEDLESVEAALDEELARLAAEGPTADEVERARTGLEADFVRGAERIGGFGGKSDVLASSLVYAGDPDAWSRRLEDIEGATPEDVRDSLRSLLSGGEFALEVHPFAERKAAAEGADRSRLPGVGEFPQASFPDLQRATLSNGLEVVLAERHAVPLVRFSLLVDAGYSADHDGIQGTASLLARTLDEGTHSRTTLEISDELDRLGATLESDANLDQHVVTMSALVENLEGSLDLLADVVLHPAFGDDEIERQRAQQIAAIQREQATPIWMALRVLPKLLYGEGHPYALPATGSGTVESVKKISRDDLVGFHGTWFRPTNATLVVVGDTSLEKVVPMLEARFASWEEAPVPAKDVTVVADRSQAEMFLIDRPGAEQSIVIAGHLAPPGGTEQEELIDTTNYVLGGAFTSRINMNLREDKGWSYGSFTLLWDAEGQRPFFVYAPVQTDKTTEAIGEIVRELDEFIGDRPATEDEVEKARRNQTLSLPGNWETIESVAESVEEIVRYGLADDHWDGFAERVESISAESVVEASRELVRPGRLVWVVVGDLAKIEPAVREVAPGPVRRLDVDGNPVAAE